MKFFDAGYVGFIVFMCVALGMALFSSGCTSVPELAEGQCVVNETQVEGIDISVPIPFLENVYFFNLRFGFIQNRLYKGNKVPYISNSYYQDLHLLKGQGSVSRSMSIGIDEQAQSTAYSIFQVELQPAPEFNKKE